MGSNTGFLKWVTRTDFYVGGFMSGESVRRFAVGGTRGQSGVAEWWTPMINFAPDKARITKVTVYTLPLGEDTVASVLWGNQEGSSLSTLMAIATSGETKFEVHPKGKLDYAWQVCLRHSAGATPRVRRIEIEYQVEKA